MVGYQSMQSRHLTSFVNTSDMGSIGDMDDFADHVDRWIDALSRMGIHAGRLQFNLHMEPWKRKDSAGISMFFVCDGHEFADATVFWRGENPELLLYDIGSGVEQLCFLQSQKSWGDVLFGNLSKYFPFSHLEALRTLVLATASPSPDSALRSLINRASRHVPKVMAVLGSDKAVHEIYSYWSSTGLEMKDFAHVLSSVQAAVIQRGID